MIEIQEVIKKSDQGYGDAHYCQGVNSKHYWVKGLAALRNCQINEWIAGHLAKRLGLPIANFCLVKISEEFYFYMPDEFKVGLGYGPAFASEHVEGASELIAKLLDSVPIELKRELLLFDYWVQNEDRTIGNPNLLWLPEAERLIVIDHNLAFDESFDEKKFFGASNAGHIFRSVKDDLFSDLVSVDESRVRLVEALSIFDDVVGKIPPEWMFADLDASYNAGIDIERKRQILERCNNERFWCRK